MLVSYEWLKSYAAFKHTPEELSVLLTDSGLEVEGLQKHESVRGALKGVVTGKVVACEPHPDADRLSITKVDVGKGDTLPIVCGAPNVKPNQKVLVALEGSTLYLNKQELKIKKVKIRGQESRGMICAEDELGLGDSHDGIMVLPIDTPVGVPASDIYEVFSDWIFEIGLTPNRIDAASHLGVARDIVAVVNHQQKKKALALQWPNLTAFVPDNNNLVIPVRVEDPQACPRYSSLTISGIEVRESPEWLRQKLLSLGLKPINNVVDVTNFVLHELGQPLHAFDVAAIKGNEVVVRKPADETAFVTLDEAELKLTGDDLMICNAEDPMCMGGILGGIDSGVSETTKDVFLESACFDPVTIRKSARHHGINTDASFRFERGSDPQMTIIALKRAAMLIKEVAGGKISSGIHDVLPNPIKPAEVALPYQLVSSLIGKEIPVNEIKNILEDLDFRILSENEEGLSLSVPTYRVDVTRPADVVEEVLRIYGYNNVDVPAKLHSSIVISPKPDKELLRNTISDLLSARGFNEIMNNSLTKRSYYEKNGFEPESVVQIVNPLSQDLNAMRQTLLFGGLESIAYNLNRKVHDMKLYEFGNVYFRDAAAANNNALPYREQLLLELFTTGRLHPETWRTPESAQDFFDLKDAVIAILRRMGVPTKDITMKQTGNGFPFAYALTLFYKKTSIAKLGKVSPKLLKDSDIRQDVFYASLAWQDIIAISAGQQLVYRDVPRFPAVRRDLALLVDADVSFAAIEELACRTEKKILREVNLFDVYQDEKLGDNKKSYAVSFVFQDNKTLTDKEVDKIMEKLAAVYGKQLGATLR